MASMKYPFATVAVALSLELYITPGLTTQRQVLQPQGFLDQRTGIGWEVSQFRPRQGIGAPPRTGGGGRRNELCVSSSEKPLTALTPRNQVGLTVSESPTFFGYIPKSSAKAGEFILMNQSNRVIYRTSFEIPSQPGIVSINLPAKELPPLEVGKMYQWYLVLVCNPDDRSDDEISAAGWIQRTQSSQALVNQLQTATPSTRPAVYAADGIWYEALASLVALRREQPNDPKLVSDWEKLLKSVGLQGFIQEPLVKYSQIKN